MSIPLGTDADIFTLGPRLIASAYVIGYNLMPVQAINSVSLLAAGAGGGVSWEFVGRATQLCVGQIDK